MSNADIPPILFDVDDLVRGRFPHHEPNWVNLGTQWRCILTNPGKSRMLAVSETALAVYPNAQDLATALLESGAFKAVEAASAEDVVLFTGSGSYRIDRIA